MSMTIEQKRAEVARLYPSASWRERVGKMPDAQILAIYQRQVLERDTRKGGGLQ